VVAAAPARAVSGGYASAGLLAWVMIAKYVEHLPLYAGSGIKRPMPDAGLCRAA
jgi:transposase